MWSIAGSNSLVSRRGGTVILIAAYDSIGWLSITPHSVILESSDQSQKNKELKKDIASRVPWTFKTSSRSSVLKVIRILTLWIKALADQVKDEEKVCKMTRFCTSVLRTTQVFTDQLSYCISELASPHMQCAVFAEGASFYHSAICQNLSAPGWSLNLSRISLLPLRKRVEQAIALEESNLSTSVCRAYHF